MPSEHWSRRSAASRADAVKRSYLLPLLLLSAIWGSSYMFIKVGIRDFSPAAMVELRLLLAGAVLVSFVAVRRGLPAVRPALAPRGVRRRRGNCDPLRADLVGRRSEERRVGK